MLGRKIIDLTLSFDQSNWKALQRWLQSPAHNTDDSLMALGSYFQETAPYHTTEKLAAELLWQQAYPGKKLNKGMLRVKLRQLTQRIEDFLIWQKLQEDPQLRQRLLLKAQTHTLAYDRFEKATLKSLKNLDEVTDPGVDFFYEKMQLQAQLINHPEFDNYRTSGAYLQAVDQSLDAFFALYKYRLGSEIKNRERILGEQYPIRFWGAIMEEQAAGLLADNITAILYQQLFLLLSHPQDDKLLEAFKNTLNDHLLQLPLRDRNNLYYTTLNYLSRLINQGGSQYYSKTLDWYRVGLTESLLLSDDRISHITFNNIALLGYQDGQFEWTDQFLSTYKNYLSSSHREDALQASATMGAFYRGDYEQAIAISMEHRFDQAYELRRRLTIVRAYYERHIRQEDVYDDLIKTIINFDNFLARNLTFSEIARQPYKNHIRLLKKLLERQLQNIKPLDNKAWLLAELASGIRVVAQTWLLEKVEVGA